MKRRWLYALLGVLLSVPLLAGNFRVGKPQQSNQSQPLGRYAFLPIEGADSWPRRVNELGYVLAGTDLWHPAHGLLIDSAGGWFRDLNNSNQVIVQRDGTNGTTLILKNLATDAETVMTSGFAPPDEYVTGVEILDRASLHGGVPANLLNDLGQTVGHVWEPWAYTVRYTLPGGGYYTNTFMVPYSSLTGRWDGATQLLSLEGAQGVPAETHYSEVSYGQFTADQRVTVAVRDQNLDDHLILWDLSSNTANVYPANYLILINNAGHTVLQQRASSPAIEVVGQGVVGHGDAYAITDSQPPPYNTPDYPMIVGSSGGFPRIWSRFKDEEGSKVWEEIDPCSPDQKYSGTLTAANSNGLIVGSLSISNQQPKAYLLVPAALAVDANRDGTIKFAGNLHDTNLTEIPPDRTSEAEPFRFWVNDDDDRDNEDHPGSEYQDRSNHIIESERDLEDFARLHIHIGALQDLVADSDIEVGLEWKGVTETNTPSVKVYQAAENNGGDQYLTNTTTAQNQVGSSGSALGIITNGGSFKFPASFWQADILSGRPALTPQQSNRYLIFEGASEGKGQLAITLWKGTNKIGEGPGVWLHLMDIKKMYVRGQGTPTNGFIAPYVQDTQLPVISYAVETPAFQASADERKVAVVFVHGWNNTIEWSWNTAETMFKRLWHKGYNGMFAAFRWPTMADGLMDHYNTSEHRAWKYGPALKEFVNKEIPSGYTVNIAAHSMGNVVVGSALNDGLSVANYGMMQAAIPAGCYNTNAAANNYQRFLTAETNSPTPNGASDLGYGGYLSTVLSNVSGSVANFYNTADFALVSGSLPIIGEVNWEKNQVDYKPNETLGYRYLRQQSEGQRCAWGNTNATGWTQQRTVSDIHESISFVARPVSQAVGATNSVGSPVNIGPDSLSDFRGAQSDHGGQFQRPIQQVQPFYGALYDLVR